MLVYQRVRIMGIRWNMIYENLWIYSTAQFLAKKGTCDQQSKLFFIPQVSFGTKPNTLWLFNSSPWYRWPIEIDDFPS
jgi:hypothetical protein